ncbi:hypothetical protein ACPCAC_05625 [Streptomyces lavendulocolor]|uniref:hypothetical protein n=1 Tax=Streptomyces lavendulocolor TaxID=67316 RepID=UPI003C2C2B3F
MARDGTATGTAAQPGGTVIGQPAADAVARALTVLRTFLRRGEDCPYESSLP